MKVRSMALQQNYETLYGFDTLDVFHNFFPEMMYDDSLFNTEMVAWMRHRISNLFPAVYTRQQNLYRIYSSQTRQQNYVTFRNNFNNTIDNQFRAPRPVTIPPLTATITNAFARGASPLRRNDGRAVSPPPVIRTAPPVPAAAAAPAAAAPATAAPATAPSAATSTVGVASVPEVANVRIPILHTADRMASVRLETLQDPMDDLLNTLLYTASQPARRNDAALLTTMLSGLGGWTTARTNINNVWTDVPVVPTAEQVESGSDIIELVDVPEEEKCAVCQERGTVNPWRHLHCDHYFHRDCVDRWFTRNVHCPVCRADIRVENVD